ncbi:hypothetical protein X801_01623, partial [Opisthorchis viverrini]
MPPISKLDLSRFQVFPDPYDKYERPPMGFIVHSKEKGNQLLDLHHRLQGFPEFGWIAVHLDPDSVEAELNALYETAENFRKENKLDANRTAGALLVLGMFYITNSSACLQDVLLAGDMNADCRYLSKRRMRELSLIKDTHYYWLIKDECDTTVHSNNCALDRSLFQGVTTKMIHKKKGDALEIEFAG